MEYQKKTPQGGCGKRADTRDSDKVHSALLVADVLQTLLENGLVSDYEVEDTLAQCQSVIVGHVTAQTHAKLSSDLATAKTTSPRRDAVSEEEREERAKELLPPRLRRLLNALEAFPFVLEQFEEAGFSGDWVHESWQRKAIEMVSLGQSAGAIGQALDESEQTDRPGSFFNERKSSKPNAVSCSPPVSAGFRRSSSDSAISSRVSASGSRSGSDHDADLCSPGSPCSPLSPGAGSRSGSGSDFSSRSDSRSGSDQAGNGLNCQQSPSSLRTLASSVARWFSSDRRRNRLSL